MFVPRIIKAIINKEVGTLKFFMSGEVDAIIADEFRELRKEIEQKLKYLEEKHYGGGLKEISIIPIVVNLTPELEEAGFFKERVLYSRKNKDADVRLRIDFDEFQKADIEKRKLLLIKNVLQSVCVLGAKVKKDFAFSTLEKDIKELFYLDFMEN